MSAPDLLRLAPLSTLLLTATLATGPAAHAGVIAVNVSAPQRDCREEPVSLEVLASLVTATGTTVPNGQTTTPCQVEAAGKGQARLTWMVRDLKQGQSRTYYLTPATAVAPGAGVELKRQGENVDFLVNGKLFTRYDTATGPTKPYFYPVNAPTGQQIVRHWPVENVPGETQDHPHHRGLWFTHGLMNGQDFWLETKGKGKTVHTGYAALQSGSVYGLMRTTTDWVAPDGKKLAQDSREVRVYSLAGGTVMDFAITVQAVGGPLLWGDTKEGTFALRMADSMRAAVEKGKVAEGHILNSVGDKDAAAWGKAATWCDYYGPVDGQTVGVAIFDDPRNPRHPTRWHVRDYGLFAVNPFGLHDYDPKKVPPGQGNLTTPEGESVTFRYRLFFHTGTTAEAHVAEVWQTLAEPLVAKLEVALPG